MALIDKARQVSLRIESLEQRIALSWGSSPPLRVVPTSALPVRLDTSASAGGNAEINNSEVNFYRFTSPQNGLFKLRAVTPTSVLDTVLALYGATGNRIAFNDDFTSTNTDSQLYVNLRAGQTYFLGITNFNNTTGGKYSWNIQGINPVADDRYEENDSLAQAANLGTLTTFTQVNNLALLDGQDWFRITTTHPGDAASYASISFTHSRGDLQLRLFNSSRFLIRTSEGTSNTERISFQGLESGTYYLQIFGNRGAKNSSYHLEFQPGQSPTASPAAKVLYLNFDGATISRTDLERWAGTQWIGKANEFDSDRNGIVVQPLLQTRTDREAIINRIIEMVQEDLRPFGLRVQRHFGLAVEGVGATTVFLGPASLTGGLTHEASMVDIGNVNSTDIAFVQNEDWGSVERTATALSDVVLHEAGHTWGLWHVDSGSAPETMGLRYSTNSSQWVTNTTFLDQTFQPYVELNGFAHGPGPQNSYQVMRQTFGQG